MTQAQLTHALDGISVKHVVAFFLVLARITPLFLVAPGFSSTDADPRVRSVLAVALALGLTPMAEHGQTIPTDVLPLSGCCSRTSWSDFALAFTIACVFAAVQGAGVFADAFGGFSFGQTVDPVNGNPGGAMTNLYAMVGLAMFLAIGGDAWTLRGLSATFKAVPIADSVAAQAADRRGGVGVLGGVVGAVEIAAPVILAVIVTDIALRHGLEGRAAAEHFRGRLPRQGRRDAADRRRVAPVHRRLDDRPTRDLAVRHPARPEDRDNIWPDNDDRTEKPTPKRRGEARDTGQVARSTDLTGAGVLHRRAVRS